MSLEAGSPNPRRAFLAAGVASIGALAAHALGRPAPAHAASSVMLGADNAASSPTVIRNDSDESRALIAVAEAGVALHGSGAKGGVLGTSETGLAVWGDSAGGYGVYGSGKTGGYFTSRPGGYALHVNGKARFSRSGRVEVPVGEDRITVRGVDLNPSSLVFANLQTQRRGVAIEGIEPDYGRELFTIYLNRPVDKETVLGWFVVN